MSNDDAEAIPAAVPALVALYDTLEWNTIASRQYVRVLEAETSADREYDLILFALAVRQVVRGGELALRVAEEYGLVEAKTRMQEMLAAVDELLPGSVNVRDLLTHFDDYRLGRGRLQRDTKARKAEVERYFKWIEADEPGTGSAPVLVLAGRYRLPSDKAMAACDALANAVSEAMRVT